MTRISSEYYTENETLWLAKDLLGKFLCTRVDGEEITAGIITETEAYLGINDRASHAWGNRKTSRTGTMYMKGGIAYIYLCYGIHSLFNVVTSHESIPHAILVRGLLPVNGISIMQKRVGNRNIEQLDGPGKLTKALGLHVGLNQTSLLGDIIWLEDRNVNFTDTNIHSGPRIGIEYAGDDSKLPYRFWVEFNNLQALRKAQQKYSE